MTREEAKEIIELLYPADSDCPDIARIGRNILRQAKNDVNDWRNEPTEVLIRYAELCRRFERYTRKED